MAWQPDSVPSPSSPRAAWPALSTSLRESIIAEGFGLVDLWELSPVRWYDDRARADEFIDWLFPGNPLLCVGLSKSKFRTERREGFRGMLETAALIVPSPMSKHWGMTKDGKKSAHSLDNTGSRKYLVVEFDQGTADDHAALHLHLASKAPLVCAVHSGGKSLHGWYYAEGQLDARLRAFMEYAVSLGADHATWLRSRFVRIPDGQREDGRRQTVFFFNPEPIR